MAAHRRHIGRFVRYPPTNRKIDSTRSAFCGSRRKIVEGWFMADEAGLLRQLGAACRPQRQRPIVPEPSTAARTPMWC